MTVCVHTSIHTLQLAMAVHDPDDSDVRNMKVTWTQNQKSGSEGLLSFTDATLVAKDLSRNCEETATCDQAIAVASVKANDMQSQSGYYITRCRLLWKIQKMTLLKRQSNWLPEVPRTIKRATTTPSRSSTTTRVRCSKRTLIDLTIV